MSSWKEISSPYPQSKKKSVNNLKCSEKTVQHSWRSRKNRNVNFVTKGHNVSLPLFLSSCVSLLSSWVFFDFWSCYFLLVSWWNVSQINKGKNLDPSNLYFANVFLFCQNKLKIPLFPQCKFGWRKSGKDIVTASKQSNVIEENAEFSVCLWQNRKTLAKYKFEGPSNLYFVNVFLFCQNKLKIPLFLQCKNRLKIWLTQIQWSISSGHRSKTNVIQFEQQENVAVIEAGRPFQTLGPW